MVVANRDCVPTRSGHGRIAERTEALLRALLCITARSVIYVTYRLPLANATAHSCSKLWRSERWMVAEEAHGVKCLCIRFFPMAQAYKGPSDKGILELIYPRGGHDDEVWCPLMMR